MSNTLKSVVESGRNVVESGASTLSDLVDEARSRIEDLPPIALPRRRRSASPLGLDSRARAPCRRADERCPARAGNKRQTLSIRPASGGARPLTLSHSVALDDQQGDVVVRFVAIGHPVQQCRTHRLRREVARLVESPSNRFRPSSIVSPRRSTSPSVNITTRSPVLNAKSAVGRCSSGARKPSNGRRPPSSRTQSPCIGASTTGTWPALRYRACPTGSNST